MDDFLDFKCPHCEEMVSFPGSQAGSVQDCPTCLQNLIVPSDGSGLGKRIPLPIKTPRLVLRRLAPADWRDLEELFADEKLFRYMEGAPLTEEQILAWLERDVHVKLTSAGQVVTLGIEVAETQKLIGYAELQITDPHRVQASLNLCLRHDFQRQGFAREALGAVLDFCFTDLKLHRATAACDSRHEAARRLFESAGMRREGEFLKNRFFQEEWVNTMHYAVLAEERLVAGKAASAAAQG